MGSTPILFRQFSPRFESANAHRGRIDEEMSTCGLPAAVGAFKVAEGALKELGKL